MICKDGNNNLLKETLKAFSENELTEDDVLYVELAGKNVKSKKHIPYEYSNIDAFQTSTSKLYTEEDTDTLYHISWKDFKNAIKNINYNENYMMPPVFDTRMRIVMKNGSYFRRIAYRYTNGSLNEFWRYVKVREMGELEEYSPSIMYIAFPHNNSTKNELENTMPMVITALD